MQLALERKESVAKPVNDDFALGAGAGQEDLRRAARFLDPHGVLAGEHHPLHFELGVGPWPSAESYRQRRFQCRHSGRRGKADASHD